MCTFLIFITILSAIIYILLYNSYNSISCSEEEICMKVLLVDDEKFAIEGLRNMLNWSGFEGELIGTASNGQEALLIAENEKPDVIISDIKMPIMDGLTLAKRIYEQSSNIDIILLSAHGEFEYAQQAIQYKVTNYILKPITREKINRLDQLLLQLKHKRHSHKQDFLHIWDHQFKDKILSGLRHTDLSVFDELFSSVLFTTPTSHETYNTIGIQLINFLYEYMSEIHINKEILNVSRQKSLAHYLDLPNQQEKANYLISKYYDILSNLKSQKHSNADTIIVFANSYILEHFSEADFNISFLADKVNVSLSYLSTLFKQSMGINLSTYIINLRLAKAKELLQNLEYSICDIGVQCGYEDSRYFAKLFKKKVGLTPSEYRNLHIQNNAIQ